MSPADPPTSSEHAARTPSPDEKEPREPAPGYGFGTFKGVFTPSILTILGVVMYLRFGWVLGNVGLAGTLLIVTLATSITFLTGLSIASLATNMKIGGGGAYYMISRSLGVETGAAVGVPLYFAQALGIAFYTAGFAESVVVLFPALNATLVGVGTLIALAVLAYFSADLALKSQFFVMGAIGLSLVAFFLGGPPAADPAAAEPTGLSLLPFWTVFAVFFPAVTGIEAGIALSGDLKNPARSLPLGTLGAILTGYAVYLAIPIFLSRVVTDRGLLLENTLIMKDVARWGALILVGIWGASLSSAMGALLGAPRTLQALARDGVIPRLFGRGFGPTDDPRIATVVSFLVGLAGILAGGLNVIAPVLSMFFLTSYGLLNLSSGLEGLIGSPSWRPSFRTPWGLSMLGAFGCFAAMFMINPGATFLAGFVSLGIYYVMQRRSLNAHWGDMRYGLLMLAARKFIYDLAHRAPDERTWRPNILVLSGSPTSRWYLIALADAISHGKGFLTVATILPTEAMTTERAMSVRGTIRDYLTRRGVPAIVKVHAGDDILAGAGDLIRTYGFGPIIPNTIMMGETEKPEHFLAYAHLIADIQRSRRNLVIVRETGAVPESPKGARIDVWWGGERDNAGLMLALAYLLQTSPEWRDATLALKTIVPAADQKEEMERRLERFIARGRLEATPTVLVHPGGPVFHTIREASHGAGLVFLGLRPPDPDEPDAAYSRYYQDLLTATDRFPPTAFVLASEHIDFQRIFD